MNGIILMPMPMATGGGDLGPHPGQVLFWSFVFAAYLVQVISVVVSLAIRDPAYLTKSDFKTKGEIFFALIPFIPWCVYIWKKFTEVGK